MRNDELRRILGEMRRCSRYRSHPLGFEDSVDANRVDDWADEIETLVLCNCIAMGNPNKPKQHSADPHAKNCGVYQGEGF